MDIGEVLSRAWRIIWKHKILWIFGIFAGCARSGGGGGGAGNSGYRASAPGGPGFNFSTQINDWIASHPWVIVLFIITVLVIVIVALVVGTIGRIGLIKGTVKADAGAEHLGFAELWDESLPFFWRIFLLVLLVGLAVLITVVALIVMGLAFTAITFGLGLLCLIPLLCLVIPALWLLQLVVQQVELAIVIENLSIADGLRRGWDVFRRNLGPILIMWVILLVIGLGVGLILAIPILVIVVPAAIAFAAANSQVTGISTVPTVPLVLALLCFAAYFPILLVLNGILLAYLQSAWTLTYLRLTRPKETTESTVIQAPNA